MRYEFDWDPQKERANIRKHGLSFRQFEQVNENLWQIRIISARKANLDETKKYNEMTI